MLPFPPPDNIIDFEIVFLFVFIFVFVSVFGSVSVTVTVSVFVTVIVFVYVYVYGYFTSGCLKYPSRQPSRGLGEQLPIHLPVSPILEGQVILSLSLHSHITTKKDAIPLTFLSPYDFQKPILPQCLFRFNPQKKP